MHGSQLSRIFATSWLTSPDQLRKIFMASPPDLWRFFAMADDEGDIFHTPGAAAAFCRRRRDRTAKGTGGLFGERDRHVADRAAAVAGEESHHQRAGGQRLAVDRGQRH